MSESYIRSNIEEPAESCSLENTETFRRTLICHVCGSTETRSQHCKVFCVKCGYLIENCSGD